MTIDEAIAKYKTMSTKGNIMFPQRLDIAEKSNLQYQQTTEWLEELKDLRKWKEWEEKSCDKYYKMGRADERAKVIEEINIILKNMYLEISNIVNGNDYTSKNDLVTIVASKCRQYISKELKQLKEQE